ncbi:MAG: DNA-directed RNA polymerase subunit A'' [Candidatus Aenigmarchaeota archaeon]|nr:DNA-directed RNA polymerase subunit A'' [Candidatus Aenigmarchaeota archaeon]
MVNNKLPDKYEDAVADSKKKKELLERYSRMIYEPGEAVGVVAAQSISEPATQTTLRSYHREGKVGLEVTQGLPRLIELFDAKKTPRTPAMDIYLDEEHNNKDDARKIAAKIKETKLKHFLALDSLDLLNMKLELELDKKQLETYDITGEAIISLISKTIKTADISLSKNIISLEIKKEDVSVKGLQDLRVKARNLHVKGIKGIEQAIVELQDGRWIIRTLGANLARVLEMPGVDMTKSKSNDIYEIARVLGIDAARNAIINEALSTMREQGVDTDVRHLLLVADAMTNDGEIRAIGRYGLAGRKSSVLSRANFEETVKHLTWAAANGDIDPLESVIENIIVGNMAPVGTGTIKLKIKE